MQNDKNIAMKTYAIDDEIVTYFQSVNESFDPCKLFCSNAWFCFNDSQMNEKYIFYENGSVSVTKKGRGNSGKWEWIKEKQLLEIEIDKKVILLIPRCIINNSILVCSLDETNKYVILIHERDRLKYNSDFDSLLKYIKIFQYHHKENEEEKCEYYRNFYRLRTEAKQMADKLMPWWFSEKFFWLCFLFLCFLIYLGPYVFIYPFSISRMIDLFLSQQPFHWVTSLCFSLILFVFFICIYYALFKERAQDVFEENLDKWHNDYPENELYKYIEFI